MIDHDTIERTCLNCGANLDAALNVTGERAPKPDDMGMCATCGHLMAYTETGFRELTKDEQLKVAGDPDVVNASRVLSLYWKERQHG